jgi:alkaline phosphatase
MKNPRSLTLILCCVAVLGALAASALAQETPQNIILFIGDGMGLPAVTATAYSQSGMGPDAHGLYFEQFPVTGYATTHSADSLVTDSAAAATALACGVKTNNGVLGLTPDGTSVESILEIAHARGKATGLVTSVPIGHATPAGFHAHVAGRGMNDAIIGGYLDDPIADVLLGGGLEHDALTLEQISARAQAAGYHWMTMDNVDDLQSVRPGDRVFGFFDQDGNKHLDYLTEREASPDILEPRLIELGRAATTALSANPNGFFLMLEGGAIDWAAHANEYRNLIDETLEFDRAIRAVCDMLQDMGKLDQTLIIVTADHETGGLTLTGPYQATLAPGAAPEEHWASNNHTALPAIVWARGPGAEALMGRHDNTDIFRAMRDAISR